MLRLLDFAEPRLYPMSILPPSELDPRVMFQPGYRHSANELEPRNHPIVAVSGRGVALSGVVLARARADQNHVAGTARRPLRFLWRRSRPRPHAFVAAIPVATARSRWPDGEVRPGSNPQLWRRCGGDYDRLEPPAPRARRPTSNPTSRIAANGPLDVANIPCPTPRSFRPW